ncbi:MAG: TetR/AcrR family transcriptional regulator [Oscillospiraceae bacterium]|nr:TetR/AcrR family transcriptional regulator [Oscillospiraceae bacterium]
MREYSEKELVIFGGVLKLAQTGAPLSEITARRIADAAGIGKATIYDYFSSKEEILVHALVYTMQQQIDATRARLDKIDGFKGKIMFIYNDIIDKMENSMSLFSVLASMGTPDKIHTIFRENGHCRMVTDIVHQIEFTLKAVINHGRNTGEITCMDRDYTYMTVTAAIFSVGRLATEKKLPREIICENAYTMLTKALN